MAESVKPRGMNEKLSEIATSKTVKNIQSCTVHRTGGAEKKVAIVVYLQIRSVGICVLQLQRIP